MDEKERETLRAWREDDAELRIPDTELGWAIVHAVDAVLAVLPSRELPQYPRDLKPTSEAPWKRVERETVAPTEDRKVLAIARNIVNQLGDLWSERIPSEKWVSVRQATNDEADQFVAALISKAREAVEAKARAEGWDALYRTQFDGMPGADLSKVTDPNNPYREGVEGARRIQG